MAKRLRLSRWTAAWVELVSMSVSVSDLSPLHIACSFPCSPRMCSKEAHVARGRRC